MIKTILIWVGVIIVLLLVALWFITGGVGRTIQQAKNMLNPVDDIFGFATSTGSAFRLPWQPDELTRGPIVSETPEENTQSPEDELANTQKEYNATVKKTHEAEIFGEPSRYRGMVHLNAAAAAEGPAAAEYLEIEASSDATAPIDISGWSMQSALTGIRAHIPRGAYLFVLGDVNEQRDIALSPGGTAVIASGASPVGTSFRENECTGYLGELQGFIPPLQRECPLPADSLPFTPENLRAYGDTCFDFVNSLPRCTFPREIPSNLSPTCRTFVMNTFSYNGCVAENRSKSDFARDTWRIYLNAGGELWRNTHDIIRLLDADGKTVDVATY